MHHNLCVFCTFSAIAQNIFKGLGCNFTWSFGKVMRIKSLKMVFVARIIRHKLCMIYAFFDLFVQKSFLTKNYFLTAKIILTTRGPLYTCLVLIFLFKNHFLTKNYFLFVEINLTTPGPMYTCLVSRTFWKVILKCIRQISELLIDFMEISDANCLRAIFFLFNTCCF